MSLVNAQKDVTRFFNSYANAFDALYHDEKRPVLGKFIDKYARASMFRRFEEAYRIFDKKNVRSVLDVGCGPGNHDVVIAKGLKARVLGIDVAENMVGIARGKAREHGVESFCEFRGGDFMDFKTGETFDAVLSLGVVEYIMKPEPFIVKMVSLCTGPVVFSLPVKWHWLTPQRAVRYRIRKCPLRFYSQNDIAKLMNEMNIRQFEILRVNRDYLVVIHARPNQPPG